ncbi:MAG: hypothetical protein ABIN89_15370 [Chitinophagaceae bacterium]
MAIHYKARDFFVSYDAEQMDAFVEKVILESMEDTGIISYWEDNIYRF